MAEVRAKGPIPFGAVTNIAGEIGSRGERDSAQHFTKAGLARVWNSSLAATVASVLLSESSIITRRFGSAP